jgi:peptide deformylase
MANRTVLTWPNSALKKVCLPVSDESFDENLETLVADLCDTLHVKMGLGLAAPQVGVNQRVVIIKATDFSKENPDPYVGDESIIVLVNPVLELSGDDITWSEGCLSVPGFTAEVSRKSDAHVSYLDIKGKKKELSASWPFSGAIQHECDHLDGRLFIDRIGRFASDSIRKKIQKRIKEKKRITAQLRREHLVDLHGEANVRKMERPLKKRNKKAEKLKSISRKKNRKK